MLINWRKAFLFSPFIKSQIFSAIITFASHSLFSKFQSIILFIPSSNLASGSEFNYLSLCATLLTNDFSTLILDEDNQIMMGRTSIWLVLAPDFYLLKNL
ncbi:hypothetical protein AA81_13015 [Petrotoga halophila DSM 16923]|jgi:hypothetical protein|uniref:Uncharacterized protein n=1 Tax=Petrotoga halophila DSM 16923 TaxID=1122953 RepID=A0A2S5E8Z6_9BACT|nr:hypothetical protein AA81_13015 [Petrotoga halophila DSM 16923]